MSDEACLGEGDPLSKLVALSVEQQSVWPVDVDLATCGFVRELRAFQRSAVARLLVAQGGANFSVPGSGKTTVAYAVFAGLRVRGVAHGMLVIAPPAAFEAWADEAHECFAPGRVPRLRIRPKSIANSDEVIVLNYERLSDPAVRAALRAWARNRKVLTVFDEAHRAKAGEKSRRGAAAAVLARSSDAVLTLTGTPQPNASSDLTAIFDLVWPGQGHRLVDGDLADVRERAFVRATKGDLALPALDLRVERVELDPAHRLLYAAMADRVGEITSSAEADAAEAGAAIMRLLAAAVHPAAVFTRGEPWSLPDDERADWDLEAILNEPMQHVRSSKIVRAAELVAENRREGRKTLVWSCFVDVVRLLGEALADHKPAVIVGATPIDDPAAPTDRVRELERFRRDPDCWVLVATPQTLGEGISLHRTCIDQIHVDRSYNAGTWLQSIDRTHRLGLPADARPTCTVLVAADTIDVRVGEVLAAKVAAMGKALNDPSLTPRDEEAE